MTAAATLRAALVMSKKKMTNGAAAAADQQVKDSDAKVRELRFEAMKECQFHVDRCARLLGKAEANRDDLSEAIMAFTEGRITWLERAAGVVGVDVRRGVFDSYMGLYWSDTDGVILMDEDDPETPLFEVKTIDDLMSRTVSPEGAVEDQAVTP